ncbi:MAG: capsid cement protein [Candidatus Bathyarchaeia archaeon]
MAAGDICKEFGLKTAKYTLKTNTGVTKGDVLAYDTDGWAPADADASTGNKGPFTVALETVAAPGEGKQATCKVLEEGVVEVNKVTGAIAKGQWVALSTTAGKVEAYSVLDAPATYTEAAMQAELDKIERRVGRCEESAASNDTTVKIRLLPL